MKLSVVPALCLSLGACGSISAVVDQSVNRISLDPPYVVDDATESFHQSLFVADLHADSLLWDRDLSAQHDHGHVDLPRLLQGGSDLQAFTVVTKFGAPQDAQGNHYSAENWNLISVLAVDQGLGFAELGSLTARALAQADRLQELKRQSNGQLQIVAKKADLHGLYENRGNPDIVGAFLGLEGAHALDGDPANVQVLFDAGFRMMAPTHHFDNRIGGSNTGVDRGGLTPKGREAIERMLELGILVDLAHASDQTIDDVLEIALAKPRQVPVVVSHTGVRGVCDKDRNLSDAQIVKIAKTGGVVGVGFWGQVLCGEASVEKIADTITYVRGVLEGSVDNIALGSDFDGFVRTAVDVTGLRLVTQALLDDGSYSRADIDKIMGGNVYRVLMETLPD